MLDSRSKGSGKWCGDVEDEGGGEKERMHMLLAAQGLSLHRHAALERFVCCT